MDMTHECAIRYRTLLCCMGLPCSSWCWRAGLAECVLRRSIEKDQTLRTGNWEIWPLSAEQQQYAALDAYASLLTYKV